MKSQEESLVSKILNSVHTASATDSLIHHTTQTTDTEIPSPVGV